MPFPFTSLVNLVFGRHQSTQEVSVNVVDEDFEDAMEVSALLGHLDIGRHAYRRQPVTICSDAAPPFVAAADDPVLLSGSYIECPGMTSPFDATHDLHNHRVPTASTTFDGESLSEAGDGPGVTADDTSDSDISMVSSLGSVSDVDDGRYNVVDYLPFAPGGYQGKPDAKDRSAVENPLSRQAAIDMGFTVHEHENTYVWFPLFATTRLSDRTSATWSTCISRTSTTVASSLR